MEEIRPITSKKTTQQHLVSLATILLVVAIGTFAVNQVMEFKFRTLYLKDPCSLCKDYNKNQSSCIDNCFKFKKTLYTTPDGDLMDSSGNCYDLTGKIINCKTNKSFYSNISFALLPRT